MNTGIISKRYARALLEFALDRKEEDVVYREMLHVAKSCEDVSGLRLALHDPMLAPDEKLSLICTASGEEVSHSFVRFIQFLIQQKREIYLQSISLVYADLYRELKNVYVGKLITAVAVSSEVENRLQQLLAGQVRGEVHLDVRTDPEIIGGFILEIGTYRLDASVNGRLKRIKQELLK